MAFRMSAFWAVESKSSSVSSANNLKKYLCVPDGGHGPPQPVRPKSVVPSVPVGAVPSEILVVDGGMFQAVQ